MNTVKPLEICIPCSMDDYEKVGAILNRLGLSKLSEFEFDENLYYFGIYASFEYMEYFPVCTQNMMIQIVSMDYLSHLVKQVHLNSEHSTFSID